MPNRIGKYELNTLIGRGATGSVYLGVDTFSGAQVAVKVIDPGVFQDPASSAVRLAQFLREASFAGKLQHPHIASIIDAVVTENGGHIVMEYVPGGSLAQHVDAENRLSVEDIIQIGFKCCGALDYAYRQGVVHRDIKPANIMLVKDTQVKITGFGAARLRTGDESGAGYVGTLAYASPEQLRGQPPTPRSDMYGLGVVLYELLTGRRPFVGGSVSALIEAIMRDEPTPPSRLRQSLPRELDAIIYTALQKAPEDRYPNWADFALDLAKIGRLSVYRQTIADSHKFEALRSAKTLDALHDAEIWELVHAGRWRRLAAQSEIIRENESDLTLYFLAQGALKVTKQGRLLNVIGAGECFGDMSYIRGGEIPRQATVTSLTDVVIAEFEAAALERLSGRCQHQLARELLRTLVDRLSLADGRVAQMQD